MSILDIIIVVLIIGGALLGYNRGFINQLVSIAGLVISYIVAYQFFSVLAPWLRKTFPVTSLVSYGKFEFLAKTLNLDTFFYNALAFALIFFCVKIGLTIAGHLLNIIAKIPGLNLANKWSGALLACVEVLLLVTIAVNVMNVTPSDKIQKLLADSQAAVFIIEHLPAITGNLQKLWNFDPGEVD